MAGSIALIVIVTYPRSNRAVVDVVLNAEPVRRNTERNVHILPPNKLERFQSQFRVCKSVSRTGHRGHVM